jgi:hypothetical protein
VSGPTLGRLHNTIGYIYTRSGHKLSMWYHVVLGHPATSLRTFMCRSPTIPGREKSGVGGTGIMTGETGYQLRSQQLYTYYYVCIAHYLNKRRFARGLVVLACTHSQLPSHLSKSVPAAGRHGAYSRGIFIGCPCCRLRVEEGHTCIHRVGILQKRTAGSTGSV